MGRRLTMQRAALNFADKHDESFEEHEKLKAM